MATHSSVLAWEIPWTDEPGRLQSRGLQKSQTHFSVAAAAAETGGQDVMGSLIFQVGVA